MPLKQGRGKILFKRLELKILKLKILEIKYVQAMGATRYCSPSQEKKHAQTNLFPQGGVP
jgi:hypothetical protein